MPTIDAIAIDRASVRTFDKDGYLHIADSLISSAQVNPYLGSEIMAVDQTLSLDPGRRYMMLRDPAALEKAVQSMHGKPLLAVHKGVTAEEHDKEIVAGSVINPRWVDPDIRAELVVWPKEDIEAIARGEKRDVSAGYRYRPIMQAGFYNGTAYDGRMVDLEFNHVALVVEGRVRGAMVADAQIQDVDMTKVFDALRPEIAARLKEQLTADATLSDVSNLLAKDEGTMATAPNMGIPKGKADDAADPEEFLKKKLSAEDKKTWDAMCASRDAKAKDAKAKDESEEEEEKKKDKADDRRAKDKKAMDDEEGMDKRAKDSDEDDDEDEKRKKKADDKKAKDKRAKDGEAPQQGMESLASTGGEAAMDAALGTAVDIAIKRERARNAAIREAEQDVTPKVGALAIAFDSAEGVYVEALSILGEDKSELKGLPLVALKSIFKRIPAPGSISSGRALAMDSGEPSGLAKMFADLPPIGRA